MATHIEKNIFDKAQGEIRGVVTAFFAIDGKKEKRVCHAYLMVDGTDITLEIPKKVPAAQIEELLALVSEFYRTVATL